MKKTLLLMLLLLSGCSNNNLIPTREPSPSITPTIEVKETKYELALFKDEVSDSYFEDVAFIGDSRMVDIHKFEAFKSGYVFAGVSLSLNKLDTKLIQTPFQEEKITIYETLSLKEFDKIYLSFGINELGYAYSEIFIEQYSDVINKIKELAPNSEIIVLQLFPVSKVIDESKDINNTNNARISEYNQLIEEMVKENKVYYFMDYSELIDEEGYLKAELTEDGTHLNKEGYAIWASILKRSTIEVNNEEDS